MQVGVLLRQFLRQPNDNPDQRIQQDIDIFTTGVGGQTNNPAYGSGNTLLFGAVGAVLSVVAFGAILWQLSGALTLGGFTLPRALFWIVIAYVLVTLIGLGITPWLARLPSLQANLMVPIVLSICFVGAYATRSRIEDVLVAAVFGVLGYVMDKYHYSRANFVIGMVLATMIERNLHISLTLHGNDFLLDRPIAAAMLVFVVVTAALPFVRNWLRARKASTGARAPS